MVAICGDIDCQEGMSTANKQRRRIGGMMRGDSFNFILMAREQLSILRIAHGRSFILFRDLSSRATGRYFSTDGASEVGGLNSTAT
jgi:hypothetical protein